MKIIIVSMAISNVREVNLVKSVTSPVSQFGQFANASWKSVVTKNVVLLIQYDFLVCVKKTIVILAMILVVNLLVICSLVGIFHFYPLTLSTSVRMGSRWVA